MHHILKRTGRLRDFLHCPRGVMFIEFALFLPFLALLLIGGYEVSRYILLTQKMDKVANTLADVISQAETLTVADVDAVLIAINELSWPYEFGSNGRVYITSVEKPVGGATRPAVVRWCYTGGGVLEEDTQVGLKDEVASLPDELAMNDRETVIIAEVFFFYRPVIAADLFNQRVLYRLAAYRPRLGALDTLHGSSGGGCHEGIAPGTT